MTRAITSPELTKLRGNEQWSALYLAIHKPAPIFAARINHTFASTDDISQFGYDTVTTGAYTDILPGMTLYIGSAAGLHDKGMVRIRKAASASMLYIGRSSDIPWADNLYLTVVDEFNLWAKHWYTPNETTVFMDRDIGYGDQNVNYDPCPVLGPDAVLWLTGATVTLSPTAADSWVLGSTISGYSWAAPGASATSGLTTVTPTITYNAPGQYRIACTVTAANGKSFTGYRRVFVYSAASQPVTAFTLDNCAGDAEAGGWSFQVTLYDQAALSDVRERAKVILFARDIYGGAVGSIGPVTGYENIIATGWIDEESIDWEAEQGAVRFSVKGPAYWLGKLATFPGGLKNSTDAPADWRYTQDLTVDKALHNLTHWRSTIDAVMDCYLSGDTRIASGLTTAPGSIWTQLKEIAARILANPICDRFGRLYIETDTQYIDTAARSSIPVVMEITKPDWTGRIRIPRRAVGELSQLETGGTDATKPYFSRTYGLIPGSYGNIESKDNLLVSSQADLNAITGHLSARRNNLYPTVNITLAANNRMVDIAPRQYVTLSIAEGDTTRGITWTAAKLIPRRVSFSADAGDGTLLAELECEGETSGAAGMTVIPPQPPQTNIPTFTPPAIDFPFFPPGNIWFPPTIPGGGGGPDSGAGCTALDAGPTGPFSFGFSPSRIDAGQEGLAYFPCTLRASAAANNSFMRLNMQFWGASESDVHFTAINDSQETVLSLSAYQVAAGYATYEIDMAPVSALGISGFKVTVDSTAKYIPIGPVLRSGSIDVMSNWTLSISGLDPEKAYCVTSTGYWNGSNGNPSADSTGFDVAGGTSLSGVAAPTETPTRQRYYWKPYPDGTIGIGFSDSPLGDNINHDFTYLVYEAMSAVIIDGAELYNICGRAV